jgi:exopolyphosphatase
MAYFSQVSRKKLFVVAPILFCSFNLLTIARASMTAKRPLKSFLDNVSKLKRGDEKLPVGQGSTIFIGNEAADADSIVSSLTYSYLRDWQQKQSTTSAASLRMPIIPLVSIGRNEMHLRRDVELLLKQVGLKLDDLHCCDEVDFLGGSGESRCDLALLDHNVVSRGLAVHLGNPSDEEKARIVKEVLDHHKDEGLYASAQIREVAFDNESGKATVASTCTLIAERFLEGTNRECLDEDIATLLVAVIALDSINMDPKAQRGTPRDQRALDELSSRFPSINRDALYDMMVNAKLDPLFWESLSAKDALRLDYKDFNAGSSGLFGISAVLQPLESFLQKPDLAVELSNYLTSSDSSGTRLKDVLVVMGFLIKPHPQRELLVFSTDKSRITALSQYLASEKCRGADFHAMKNAPKTITASSGETVHVLAYHQGNVALSRKQIAPMLSEFYSL